MAPCCPGEGQEEPEQEALCRASWLQSKGIVTDWVLRLLYTSHGGEVFTGSFRCLRVVQLHRDDTEDFGHPLICVPLTLLPWQLPDQSALQLFPTVASSPTINSSLLPKSLLPFCSKASPSRKCRVELTPLLWLRWELLCKGDQEPPRLAGRCVQGWEGGTEQPRGSGIHKVEAEPPDILAVKF